MTGLDRNAELQTLIFELLHEGDHACRDCPEVVILQLLVLGRLVSHEGSARQHQVGAHGPQTLIDEEVLLLPAEVGVDLLDRAVEVVADLRGGLINGRNRAQEGHFVVERLARVGDEDGRNTERSIHDKGGRCGIPGRVAARLEGVADAAVGERRSIRLGLRQELTRELLDHATEAVRLCEGIVFLGRAARQGLKPVRIVVGTMLQGPLAHAGGDRVGHLALQGRSVGHRVRKGLKGFLVEVFAHRLTAEHFSPEVIRRTAFGSLYLHGRVINGRIDHLKSQQG